jgi:hypothetical protein
LTEDWIRGRKPANANFLAAETQDGRLLGVLPYSTHGAASQGAKKPL